MDEFKELPKKKEGKPEKSSMLENKVSFFDEESDEEEANELEKIPKIQRIQRVDDNEEEEEEIKEEEEIEEEEAKQEPIPKFRIEAPVKIDEKAIKEKGKIYLFTEYNGKKLRLYRAMSKGEHDELINTIEKENKAIFKWEASKGENSNAEKFFASDPRYLQESGMAGKKHRNYIAKIYLRPTVLKELILNPDKSEMTKETKETAFGKKHSKINRANEKPKPILLKTESAKNKVKKAKSGVKNVKPNKKFQNSPDDLYNIATASINIGFRKRGNLLKDFADYIVSIKLISLKDNPKWLDKGEKSNLDDDFYENKGSNEVQIDGDNYITQSGVTYDVLSNPSYHGHCFWQLLRNHDIGEEILIEVAKDIGGQYNDYVGIDDVKNLITVLNAKYNIKLNVHIEAFSYDGSIYKNYGNFGEGGDNIYIGLVFDPNIGLGHYIEGIPSREC